MNVTFMLLVELHGYDGRPSRAVIFLERVAKNTLTNICRTTV